MRLSWGTLGFIWASVAVLGFWAHAYWLASGELGSTPTHGAAGGAYWLLLSANAVVAVVVCVALSVPRYRKRDVCLVVSGYFLSVPILSGIGGMSVAAFIGAAMGIWYDVGLLPRRKRTGEGHA